jgi:chromosome partitioning protein
VVGNEKGGTGKSTVSTHIIFHLLHVGYRVGSMDLDARQGSLTRFLENRAARKDNTLSQPLHTAIHRSDAPLQEDACKQEEALFLSAMEKAAPCHFVVIDTPGSDSWLSRLAHSWADTLVTPLNDSLVDLDMLVRLDGPGLKIVRPSTYAEMVWEQKKKKALRQKGGAIDWIVMRNRLSSIRSRNKEDMQDTLETLSRRIAFRQAPGFTERVVFRSLFMQGLTLLDLEADQKMMLSHVSARQELRELVDALNLPVLKAA